MNINPGEHEAEGCIRGLVRTSGGACLGRFVLTLFGLTTQGSVPLRIFSRCL